MSFGTQQWGLGPFGGLATNLAVEFAYAITTNEVVVVLNKPPMNRSGFLNGDVLNPSSWEISIPGTDETLEVAGIAVFDDPLRWVIRSATRFPPSTSTVRITATNLKDASEAIIGPANFADFAGVTEAATATPTALAISRRAGGRDLANYSAPQVAGETNISGTFVIKGGDYALMEGSALFRKLMVRRLISTPGDFFHLPNYGIGLRVKQPIPASDLVKLKANIERQLKLERDVANVVVSILQDQNTLTVQIKATLARSGQNVAVSINSPIGQG